MKNKIYKIEVDTWKEKRYVTFFFVDNPDVPYSANEFKKITETRKLLDKIEKEILKSYE